MAGETQRFLEMLSETYTLRTGASYYEKENALFHNIESVISLRA